VLEIWRRSDSTQVQRASGAYELDCWAQYLFLSDAPVSLPAYVASRRPGSVEGCFEYDVNFQDFVGLAHIGDGLIRVSSSKLDGEGFDRLLTDLSASAASLPFDFHTPTFVPHERVATQSKDVLYHVFAYLRWALFESTPSITELLSLIEADPHRRLVHRDRATSIDRARRVGPREIACIAAGRSVWRTLPDSHVMVETALARRARHVTGEPALPDCIRETIREECVDTPENRFVRYLLLWIKALSERVLEMLGDTLDEAARGQAVRICEEVGRLSRAEWLSEVGEMRSFPANSQVLLRKHGYRELLGHYLALVMSSRYPIGGADLRRIIETKSASALYEYWVYFEVIRSVERVLGKRPTKGARIVTSDELRPHIDHGVSVEFGPDVEVIYNRRFSGNRPTARFGSYSLPLRPDVLLRVGDDVFVFDAKFRVERATGWLPKTDEEREEVLALDPENQDDGVARWFKAADIHKMHAYRDAVRHGGLRVASAWAIYPGSEFCFYSDMKGRIIVREDVPPELEGVGAIPLEPMGERTSLDCVVRAMLTPDAA